MIKGPPKIYRGDGSGIVWPDSGTSTSSDITDVFGPRPFAPHIPTVGYDYDFHRGIDVAADEGDSVYAAQTGSVQRWHFTHFGWQADSQLEQWVEVDPNNSVTFSRQETDVLRVTGSRVGAQTFPQGAGRFETTREKVQISDASWELRLNFKDVPNTSGFLGFGLLDTETDELLSMEYDGTTIGVRSVDSTGAKTEDGDTEAIGSQTWLRIRYDGDVSVFWERALDTSSWTTVSSGTLGTFTHSVTPKFSPTIYWRSTDTDGTPDTVDIDFLGWFDNQTIPRFGNWISIQNLNTQALCMHMRELVVSQGDFIHTAGTQIGTAGTTGFDYISGDILTPHIHMEIVDSPDYFYSNSYPVNPLTAGFLPRINSSSNVSTVRTTENDPDGTDSWKLAITVSRASQDFDLNTVTLTGNLATRTINFNTRAGLNSNNDIPKEAGVYIVPSDFDGESASYDITVYFNKSVVGNTFTSYSITDTEGTVIDSE
jgi:hypothetical protein